MSLYRSIETVDDIQTCSVVFSGRQIEARIVFLKNALHPDCTFQFYDQGGLLAILNGVPPDIIFILSPSGRPPADEVRSCQSLRAQGYEGVIIFVANERSEVGGTSFITSRGFDHYLTPDEDPAVVQDGILWAILNRRRRNKYALQFDHNPDMFFTVDAEGKIYDLNECACRGSLYTPKEVVNRGIPAGELKTLSCFPDMVRPRISPRNINKVFSTTVQEADATFQVTTKIHNVPTIGLVATVVKTDISLAMYSNTMDILINSITLLSQRDNYTASHSARVFFYCFRIAEQMNLMRNRKFRRDLFIASILHDVGKIGVRDNILLKPGKLDKKEFNSLARHPIKGYELLQNFNILKDASKMVRAHHERPDGKGYPDGLQEAATPLGAYIIGVADSFDAMTTSRPYRRALAYDRAVAEIRSNLGTQYHRVVGAKFINIIQPELVKEAGILATKSLSEISQDIISTILK